KELSQYMHDEWQVDDGLPQNSVRALAQTQDGYLWLGTDDGLVRFDGQKFKVFNRSNVKALRHGHAIRALHVDNYGALWIGTSESGLVRFTDGNFSRVKSVDAAAISHVSADASGTMWIGTLDAGLFILKDDEIRHYSTESGLLTNYVTVVQVDAGSRAWIGTREGLHILEGQSVSPWSGNQGLSSQHVTDLEAGENDQIWVGTLAGLHLVENDLLVPVPSELESTTGVRAIWKDPSGAVWVGTDQTGLLRFVNGEVSIADATNGILSSNRVLEFFEDAEGSLWIGTEMGGLNRLRDGIFTPYSESEGFVNDMSYAVAEDAAGNMWIGSDGGLNQIKKDGSVSSFLKEDGLTSDVVMSLAPSRTGGLWIGTLGGGLNYYKDGVFRRPIGSRALPSQRIFALSESRNGDLWIGTDAGAVRYSGGSTKTFTTADGLASDFLTSIQIGSDGTVWFGTNDGGVSRLSKGKFTNTSTDNGLSDNQVFDILEDEEGDIWIGTSNGLSIYRDGEFRVYTSVNGLPSDVILSIVEDDTGSLWFSSTDGVFRVHKSEFDKADSGDSIVAVYHFFDRQHGMRSSEMSGGFQPSSWKSNDGRLWFPSSVGVASVDPSNIFRNEVPPPVTLQNIVVDGQHQRIDNDLVFKPGSKRIDIAYAGLSYIMPRSMQYRYILDGYESNWQAAGNSRVATYTNLDPGQYTFRVVASNSDGEWNTTGAHFSFYLKPFFYQTTWFYGLCALVLLLVAYSGYYVRVRQLKSREAELEATVEKRTRELRFEKETTERQAAELEKLSQFKMRFFANVSHEFRTPLTMIVGPLENVISGSYGPISDGLRRQLEIMLRNSLRLMRLINQLLDLQKIEAGKMQLKATASPIPSFVEGILFSCSALAEQNSIDLRFENNAADSEIYFEPDKMEKVFYNLISNALKFTPSGGVISIAINQKEATDMLPSGAVEIQIADTGVGIDAESLTTIFDRFTQAAGDQPKKHEGTGIGLALVKDLVVLHGGSIEVESSVGEGTVFTIVLRKGRAHLDDDDIATGEESFAEEITVPNVAMIGADVETTTDIVSPMVRVETTSERDPLVLIVDDNIDICQYMEQILESQFQIQLANDGSEGWEKVLKYHPDLIISDIQMPKMDGNQLCKKVKENEDTRDIPVILLTARATSETVVEGLASGADDYMSKPFNARELILRVTNLIQLFKQKRALTDMNEQLTDMVQEQLDVILEEREEYERSLIVAKEKAESSNRLKSSILDNISHEFRTPVTVILGYVDILVEEAPAALGPFVQDIKQNSNRLLRTLDALLKYSELETSTIDDQYEFFDAIDTLTEILDRFRPVVTQKNIGLRLVEPDQRIALTCDIERFRYVVDNIVDNAVKFTTEGEVKLSMSVRDEQLEIDIDDSGVGIQPEFLPKLFETFSQESIGTSRAFEGTGLGLAFAKRLANQIGGDIKVESTPNVGSKFTIIIPEGLFIMSRIGSKAS
ncbi:MAG: response regulator, partial [Rhodothermales bacterium]|nr:response regulator [Rhodothermales bacterium]